MCGSHFSFVILDKAHWGCLSTFIRQREAWMVWVNGYSPFSQTVHTSLIAHRKQMILWCERFYEQQDNVPSQTLKHQLGPHRIRKNNRISASCLSGSAKCLFEIGREPFMQLTTLRAFISSTHPDECQWTYIGSLNSFVYVVGQDPL